METATDVHTSLPSVEEQEEIIGQEPAATPSKQTATPGLLKRKRGTQPSTSGRGTAPKKRRSFLSPSPPDSNLTAQKVGASPKVLTPSSFATRKRILARASVAKAILSPAKNFPFSPSRPTFSPSPFKVSTQRRRPRRSMQRPGSRVAKQTKKQLALKPANKSPGPMTPKVVQKRRRSSSGAASTFQPMSISGLDLLLQASESSPLKSGGKPPRMSLTPTRKSSPSTSQTPSTLSGSPYKRRPAHYRLPTPTNLFNTSPVTASPSSSQKISGKGSAQGGGSTTPPVSTRRGRPPYTHTSARLGLKFGRPRRGPPHRASPPGAANSSAPTQGAAGQQQSPEMPPPPPVGGPATASASGAPGPDSAEKGPRAVLRRRQSIGSNASSSPGTANTSPGSEGRAGAATPHTGPGARRAELARAGRARDTSAPGRSPEGGAVEGGSAGKGRRRREAEAEAEEEEEEEEEEDLEEKQAKSEIQERMAASVATNAQEAAVAASCRWLDVLALDNKGRLAAVRRSSRRVQRALLHWEAQLAEKANESPVDPEGSATGTVILLRQMSLALHAQREGLGRNLQQVEELRGLCGGAPVLKRTTSAVSSTATTPRPRKSPKGSAPQVMSAAESPQAREAEGAAGFGEGSKEKAEGAKDAREGGSGGCGPQDAEEAQTAMTKWAAAAAVISTAAATALRRGPKKPLIPIRMSPNLEMPPGAAETPRFNESQASSEQAMEEPTQE